MGMRREVREGITSIIIIIFLLLLFFILVFVSMPMASFPILFFSLSLSYSFSFFAPFFTVPSQLEGPSQPLSLFLHSPMIPPLSVPLLLFPSLSLRFSLRHHYLIHYLARIVVNFNRIHMYERSGVVYAHSPTTLFGQPRSVLHLHITLTKVASIKIERGAVERAQFRPSHVVDLLLQVKRVAVRKTSPFRCMCMQIDIVREQASMMQRYHILLRREYSGMKVTRWVIIVPVQIHTSAITSIMTARNPIRIDQGHHFEHKYVTQLPRTRVL
mmetsp:Transcript_35463/g.92374  ORF Transcript_35463/g.92374 Transcript_35463/m.92374 type:complete len:271 (-) Transcript_35463:1005-1817(-)